MALYMTMGAIFHSEANVGAVANSSADDGDHNNTRKD
jgi:hypothetical protein